MVKVAKDFFGFHEDGVVKSVIADAYKFVLDYSQPKFDIVFMDINYEEDNLHLSPPKKFLDPAFLQKLVDITTNDGYVTFNLLTYDK